MSCFVIRPHGLSIDEDPFDWEHEDTLVDFPPRADDGARTKDDFATSEPSQAE
jgi:hypothetical protein